MVCPRNLNQEALLLYATNSSITQACQHPHLLLVCCWPGGHVHQPRQAGNFVPGLPKASAGESGILRAKTWRLGQTESQESLAAAAGSSPMPRALSFSSSPTAEPPRRSFSEDYPHAIFVIERSEGWKERLFQVCKNLGSGWDGFCVEGNHREFHFASSAGVLHEEPGADEFPLRVVSKPVEATLHSPGADEALGGTPESLGNTDPTELAETLRMESPALAPMEAGDTPSNQSDEQHGNTGTEPANTEPAAATTPAETVPSGSVSPEPPAPSGSVSPPPPDTPGSDLSMYEDGSYWKILDTISIHPCHSISCSPCQYITYMIP